MASDVVREISKFNLYRTGQNYFALQSVIYSLQSHEIASTGLESGSQSMLSRDCLTVRWLTGFPHSAYTVYHVL